MANLFLHSLPNSYSCLHFLDVQNETAFGVELQNMRIDIKAAAEACTSKSKTIIRRTGSNSQLQWSVNGNINYVCSQSTNEFVQNLQLYVHINFRHFTLTCRVGIS